MSTRGLYAESACTRYGRAEHVHRRTQSTTKRRATSDQILDPRKLPVLEELRVFLDPGVVDEPVGLLQKNWIASPEKNASAQTQDFGQAAQPFG